MGKKSINYRNDLMKSLKDPKEKAAYINAALEDGDSKVLLMALKNVAEANGGISSLASRTRTPRENPYRILLKNGNPKLENLEKILHSFGLKLFVQPEQSFHPRFQ